MKGKKISILMAALMAAGALVGCGGGGDDSTGPAKTDLTTWESLQSGETVEITLAGRDVDTEKANFQQFVNDFNATHDNIVVTLEWWSDSTAYNVALDGMGKNLPDVFMLNDMMFVSYAVSGKLANIRDYVDQEILGDLYPTAYESYCFDHDTNQKGLTENAAMYGLPKDQGPYALGINETLLKEKVAQYNQTADTSKQIDINKIMDLDNPMTFEYFLEIGEKLKSVMGADQYVCTGYDIQSTVYSNNATFFEDDTGRTADIDNDNFVGAMQFIQDMYKKGILPAAGTTSSGATVFTSGNSLFYYTDIGPWKTKDFWQSCSFEWNILPVLQGTAEGAVSTACVGGMCYAISNNSKYKDAALELVEYLAADITSQRTQYSRGQCIPNLVSLAKEYETDQHGFIAKQSTKTNPNPTNRSVWIDVVDGVGQKQDENGNTYTDKITGRTRAQSFTPDSTWYSSFTQFCGGSLGSWGSFWEPKSDGSWVDIRAALTAYEASMQAELDDVWTFIDMY